MDVCGGLRPVVAVLVEQKLEGEWLELFGEDVEAERAKSDGLEGDDGAWPAESLKTVKHHHRAAKAWPSRLPHFDVTVATSDGTVRKHPTA